LKVMPETQAPKVPEAGEELVDAVLAASRALVVVAARSLAHVADDVALAQYQALVELAARGPQRLADLAAALAVDPSTATRMCDRLVRKGLASRRRANTDRRSVKVLLTSTGRSLVEVVTSRRRAELATILAHLPDEDRRPVLAALRAFAEGAGELPERQWSLGWRLDRQGPSSQCQTVGPAWRSAPNHCHNP
jgi:DNA-binding MarR family transcriptional regulator